VSAVIATQIAFRAFIARSSLMVLRDVRPFCAFRRRTGSMQAW
jgi:hypothetical protein